MKSDIFLALLEKHAIGNDNIVTACYTITDLFGRKLSRSADFRITNIYTDSHKVVFDLCSLSEEKSINVSSEAITLIDGMDIGRYADIYDLLPDGSHKKVGKKRGRKPKKHLSL